MPAVCPYQVTSGNKNKAHEMTLWNEKMTHALQRLFSKVNLMGRDNILTRLTDITEKKPQGKLSDPQALLHL